MIPHVCTVKHDPPRSHGDCLRACIASIFDIEDADTVPHFYMASDYIVGNELLRAWLAERGLRPFVTAIGGLEQWSDIQAMMSDANPTIDYLLFCDCGDGDHVVVCRGGRMVHNPAMVRSEPRRPTSQGYWVIMVFVPLVLK